MLCRYQSRRHLLQQLQDRLQRRNSHHLSAHLHRNNCNHSHDLRVLSSPDLPVPQVRQALEGEDLSPRPAQQLGVPVLVDREV